MKDFLKDILNLVADNWVIVSPIVAEILLRVIPTKWNLSIVDNIVKLLGIVIKNRRSPDAADVVDFKDSSINKVIVERDKHIISSLLIGMLMLSSCGWAQNPVNATALRLVNVNDSTIMTANPINATLYYNKQSNKPRFYWNGSWHDVGTGSSGGNLSGTLISGRIPFATGTHTLSDASNLTWNSGANILRISDNPGTTFVNISPTQIVGTAPGGTFGISSSTGILVNSSGTSGARLLATGSGTADVVSFSGAVALSGNTTATVSSSGNVVVSAGTSIAQTATTTASLQSGSGTATLRSTGAAALVQGNSAATLQAGSSTATVRSTGADVLISGSTTISEFAGTDYSLDAGGDISWTSNGASNLNAAAAINITAGPGGVTITSDDFAGFSNSTQSVSLGIDNSNGSIFANGTGPIEILSGSDITIDNNTASNKMDLNSTTINLNGSTTVNVSHLGIGPYPVMFGPSLSTIQDFANTASLGETTIGVIVLTGALTTHGCLVTAPSTVGVFTCRVPAAGSISITFHNTTSAAVDPANGTYIVKLM